MNEYFISKYFKGIVVFVPEGKLRVFFPHKFILVNGAVVRISAKHYYRIGSQSNRLQMICVTIIATLEAIKIIEDENSKRKHCRDDAR